MSENTNTTTTTTEDTSTTANSKKLGVLALTGVVVSAMIGGGIYNLPQNMAQSASAGAIVISWIITGIGIWFIANTFRILSAARPDATTGIYTYGKLGFGNFTGFLMAWGYWISNSVSNVAYAVLLMDAFNYFFPPYFAGGNDWLSISIGSVVLWCMYFAVLADVKQVSAANVIGTICKLLPLGVFIVIVLFSFKSSNFFTDFWGLHTVARVHDGDLGSILSQTKSTMLVTLWAFMGIEGAVVVSERATSQKDVSRATLFGFIICLVVYSVLSLAPLGVYSQGMISKMAPPSTAAILRDMVGEWGSVFMNFGVIVAILSSWLIWTVMLTQLPYAAAKTGTFPKAFAQTNKNNSPSFSILVSTIMMQVFLILVHFTGHAWNTTLSITSVMALPVYLISTLYLFKIAYKNDYPTNIFATRKHALITGLLGSIYGVWMIYAAGLNYMLLAGVIYALGIPVFMMARRESAPGEKEFTKGEKIFAFLLILIAVIGVIYYVMNYM